MKVATAHRLVTAEPGTSVELRVDVVNNGDLIDGVTARLIGLPADSVTAEPLVLPLFPDASGQITLSIAVPASQPAGLHPLTVEVVSHGTDAPSQFVDVDLSVSARPGIRISSDPRMVRARRTGRFVLAVENTGNVAMDVTLAVPGGDRVTTTTFSPAAVRVEPATVVPVMLSVRGPRMVTGGELDRTVKVEVVGRRVHSIPAMDEAETEPEFTGECPVVLRQRPLISRGLLTALVLAGIVALWALVFLLGLSKVFAGDPMTKTAAISYAETDAQNAGMVNAANSPPPGALAKTGLLAPGVGGSISGTVIAKSSQEPVGRILVEAFRRGPSGPKLVSSGASQTDGTYTLAGLFPTSYLLRFRAVGFKPVWYPAAATRAGAKPVKVGVQGALEGYDAVMTGLPARISGSIDPGDSLLPARTDVVVRLLSNTGEAEPVARTTTDADGGYAISGLASPATYQLSFTAPGYAPTRLVQAIGGGEQRMLPNVLLSAGAGQISGTVTDGSSPLGGVTVTTTVAGREVSVITPTVGLVGSFTLGDLPTPGTYVVRFSASGHGSRTAIVDLEAGQSRRELNGSLASGTGSVSGVLTGPDGNGLGGATVTVGGAAGVAPPSTTTLTEGAVGSFAISGLPAPGRYTLTFTMAGYAPETLPVVLSARGPARQADMRLGRRLGRISGRVLGPSGILSGATVTATNGSESWTAISSGPGPVLRRGGYLIPDLPPGTYSVTATADGMRRQTGIVTIDDDDLSPEQDLRLTTDVD